MRRYFFLAVLLVVVIGAGCAKPVALQENFWQERQAKIGVAYVVAPPAKAYRTGNEKILDALINEAVTNELQQFLATLKIKDYDRFCDEIVKGLNSNGMTASRTTQAIVFKDMADFTAPSSEYRYEVKDFRGYAQTLGVDKLIIFWIRSWGTTRDYYGFLPLGPPRAFCLAAGEMVDLSTNKIIWLETFRSEVQVTGNWDNPPAFPELTQAIQVAVGNTRSSMKQVFTPSQPGQASASR